jgi:hypothetical protein
MACDWRPFKSFTKMVSGATVAIATTVDHAKLI